MVEISVVVPVYGCRECLQALHSRLTDVLASLGVTYEIVFVDDRSPDGAWASLQRLAEVDRHVRSVRLSRNFGQHVAITAGLSKSEGRWTVVMDCDLQDPPESIPALYAEALSGHDVVLARRKERQGPALRKVFARAYFALINAFMGTHFDGEYGTLSILSAKVRRAFLELRERDRHYLFVIHWLGFDQGSIDVLHADRPAGRSAYDFRALVRHALSGVFFQTTSVLAYIVYLGFAFALSGLALAAYFLYLYFVATPPPGFTSLIVFVLVIGGVTISCLGVTGLYIGRIFEQVKDRPLFIVDTEEGGATADPTEGAPAARQPVGAAR